MSRIGKLPITVPAGVEVKISDTNEITVKGKNGTLSRQLHPDMIVKLNDGVITVERPSEDKMHKSLHGLTRTLVIWLSVLQKALQKSLKSTVLVTELQCKARLLT